jgi:hypothetical protein
MSDSAVEHTESSVARLPSRKLRDSSSSTPVGMSEEAAEAAMCPFSDTKALGSRITSGETVCRYAQRWPLIEYISKITYPSRNYFGQLLPIACATQVMVIANMPENVTRTAPFIEPLLKVL